MKENKQALMKLFSLVLKDRAKSEPQFREISPEMVRFFSRKELVEIITGIFDGKVPQEYNLVEMENAGLLGLIGDDLYIISYVTQKWSREVASLPLKPAHPINAVPAVATESVAADSTAPKDAEPKGGNQKKN